MPTRREFLGSSFAALPTAWYRQAPRGGGASSGLHVVAVGGHPDDPETGCGGTLARYAAAGHRVTVVYLTRGERGIPGKSLDGAAAIRTKEAEEACRLLGARPLFAGQIDGDTRLDRDHIAAFTRLLTEQEPDLLFAH